MEFMKFSKLKIVQLFMLVCVDISRPVKSPVLCECYAVHSGTSGSPRKWSSTFCRPPSRAVRPRTRRGSPPSYQRVFNFIVDSWTNSVRHPQLSAPPGDGGRKQWWRGRSSEGGTVASWPSYRRMAARGGGDWPSFVHVVCTNLNHCHHCSVLTLKPLTLFWWHPIVAARHGHGGGERGTGAPLGLEY